MNLHRHIKSGSHGTRTHSRLLGAYMGRTVANLHEPDGAGDVTRTHDHFITSEVLYLLSYTSVYKENMELMSGLEPLTYGLQIRCSAN